MSKIYHPPSARGHGPLGLVLGVAFSILLFVGMALAQLMQTQPKGQEDAAAEIFSLPPPEIEEIEEVEPPPPPEEEPPPEMEQEPPQISLEQIEMSLSVGSGGTEGGFDISLPGMDTGNAGAIDMKDFFDLSELDQNPAIVRRVQPDLPRKFRSRSNPWEARIEFIIGTDGRVAEIISTEATEPEVIEYLVDAIREMQYETGTVNGKPVRFRVALPFAIR